MTEEYKGLIEGSQTIFATQIKSNLYDFYLSGVIEDAEKYNEWFNIIRNATEFDDIIIHINSYGGDVFTTLQMIRAMAECKANITCSVEGACMSAATYIFLAGKQFLVTEHSMFMFHNYSGGTFGKGGEMYDNIMHERKWSQKLMNDMYTGFLTKEEINSLLDNKDIWMDGEEVIKRIELKNKIEEEPKRKRTRKSNAQ